MQTLNLKGTESIYTWHSTKLDLVSEMNSLNEFSCCSAERHALTRICFRAPVAHSQATNWQVVIGLTAVNQTRLALNDSSEPGDAVKTCTFWVVLISLWKNTKMNEERSKGSPGCHIPATGEGFRRTTHRVFHCGEVWKETVNHKVHTCSWLWRVEKTF